MTTIESAGRYAGGEKPDELPSKRTLGEPQLRRPSSSSAEPKPPPECCEEIKGRRVGGGGWGGGMVNRTHKKKGPHTL